MKLLIVAVPNNVTSDELARISKQIVIIAKASSPLHVLDSSDLTIQELKKNDFQIAVDSIITICGNPENRQKFINNFFINCIKGKPGFEKSVFNFIKKEANREENRKYIEENNAELLMCLINDIL